MIRQFYRVLDQKYGAEATKVADVPRERGIRLYSSMAGQQWSLQVRTPMVLSDRREGRDFIVATAKLGRDDLVALRDAINAELAYVEKLEQQNEE